VTHRLRFGLHSIGDDPAEHARQAEGAGFDVLTVADHLVDGLVDPFAALTAAASATSTIRLGTLVLNNDLRNVAIVARQALALDAMSGGRLELGLGAGHGWPEYEQVGIPFDAPAVRVARLRESIEALDGLLRGDEVTVDGEHVHVRAHRSFPPPSQSPRLPLLVGGHARSVLRLAAERCDIVGLSGTGKTMEDGLRHEATGFAPSVVDERVGVIRDAAGDRDVELNVLVQAVVVTDDPRAVADQWVAMAPYLSVDDVLGSPYVWAGSVESICDDVRGYAERWGTTYFTLFSHSFDAAAPIVAALSSTS
jgi:probable F420-dependent oxidoreductase